MKHMNLVILNHEEDAIVTMQQMADFLFEGVILGCQRAASSHLSQGSDECFEFAVPAVGGVRRLLSDPLISILDPVRGGRFDDDLYSSCLPGDFVFTTNIVENLIRWTSLAGFHLL